MTLYCICPDDGEWCDDLDTVPERLQGSGEPPIYYCIHAAEPIDDPSKPAPKWCHRRGEP